jgi:hypothetical protein
MAIQAWAEHQQQLKQQRLDECRNLQQAKQGRRRAAPVRVNSGGVGTPENQEA